MIQITKILCMFVVLIQSKVVMKAKVNFRSVVFKRAYLLVKRSSCTFSAALKEAWAGYRRLRATMMNRERLIQELSGILKAFEDINSGITNRRVNLRWQPVGSQTKRELNEKLRTIFI